MALNQLEKQAIIDREGMSPIYNSGLVGVTIPANRTIDDVIDNARTAEDFLHPFYMQVVHLNLVILLMINIILLGLLILLALLSKVVIIL